ncbi:unnamed protein product [Amoebophrya sp. A25]|nr:unnamed protein product [Amoebophrya sp. A25]|eukprot:GSA25T00002025001.1
MLAGGELPTRQHLDARSSTTDGGAGDSLSPASSPGGTEGGRNKFRRARNRLRITHLLNSSSRSSTKGNESGIPRLESFSSSASVMSSGSGPPGPVPTSALPLSRPSVSGMSGVSSTSGNSRIMEHASELKNSGAANLLALGGDHKSFIL